MNEYTYTVFETNNDDPMESIIEKHGVTVKFTGNQIIDHIVHTKKTLKQSLSQIQIEDKQDELALEILPMLKDIPADKYAVAIGYIERQIARPSLNDLIETCENTITSYEKQVELIKDQVGIEIELPVESPYQTKHAEEENKDSGTSGEGDTDVSKD